MTSQPINTRIHFGPPTSETPNATWVIEHDDQSERDSKATYTYKLVGMSSENPPEGWGFSGVTFQVPQEAGSTSAWNTYAYSTSVTPRTPVPNPDQDRASISIVSFDERELTLSVTNQLEPKEDPIKIGILLTVTNGISSFISPDPQLVLEPRQP
jgi:hypothetical protein